VTSLLLLPGNSGKLATFDGKSDQLVTLAWQEIMKSTEAIAMDESCYPGHWNILGSHFIMKSTRTVAIDSSCNPGQLNIRGKDITRSIAGTMSSQRQIPISQLAWVNSHGQLQILSKNFIMKTKKTRQPGNRVPHLDNTHAGQLNVEK